MTLAQQTPLFNRVAIIGSGLIGGSLAAALRKREVACHIAVHDVSEKALVFLEALNYVHSTHHTVAPAVEEAELVILAAPPSALAVLSEAIAPHLPEGCIVTDVASVKQQAINAIAPHLPAHVHYVPAHPIAGSEKTGAEASQQDLFDGKRVILTPSEEQLLSPAVARVKKLWEALGATVEYMPAELHDRVYAYISHLPQLVAFAAAPQVHSAEMACSGVVRLARSNPQLWADIALANRHNVHEALGEFAVFLHQMQQELAEPEEEPQATPEGSPPSPSALHCSVIALCLVATALLLEQRTGAHVARYGGSGFRDMTAASGTKSDEVLTAISAQPKEVAALLKRTLNNLQMIDTTLLQGDPVYLSAALSSLSHRENA